MADPLIDLVNLIQLNDSDFDISSDTDSADESPDGTGLEVGVDRDEMSQDVEERATEENVEEEHDSDLLRQSPLKANSIMTLPCLRHHAILVPGQVISLNLYAETVAHIERWAPDSNRTFAVLLSGYRFKFGCTAELFSMKDETEGWTGLSMVVGKARGRQRLEVIRTMRSRRSPRVKVRILPEPSCSHGLSGVQVASLRKCPPPSLDNKDDRIKPRFTRLFAAHFARWPQWVYKLYDIDWLSQQLRLELKSWFPGTLPEDSLELSHWFISNVVIRRELGTLLFSFDSVVRRLRCSLSIMRKSKVTLHCQGCNVEISSQKELFNMGQDSPLVTFVSPGGKLHEMFTVLSASDVVSVGDASMKHSWFPGYAWTPIKCSNVCHNRPLGWMFTSTVPSLSPQNFWGLRHSSICIEFSERNGKDKEQRAELMYTM